MQVWKANDKRVRDLLLDFRTVYEGRKVVGLLRGEGKLNQSTNSHIVVRFEDQEKWLANLPSLFVRWCTALRFKYFIFTFAAQAIVLAKAWPYFAILEATTIFFFLFALQASCTLWNDFEDHMQGVDAPEHTGGSGVIQKLWLPAIQLRNAAFFCLVLAVVLGFVCLWQIWQTDKLATILPVSLISLLLALSYTSSVLRLKYLALGEFTIFLLCGPFLVYAYSVAILPAAWSWQAVALYSFPLGLFASARLFLNNMQRIPYDRKANCQTLATLFRFRWSKRIFWLFPFLLSAYALVFFLVAKPFYMAAGLLLLALPAFYLGAKVQSLTSPQDVRWSKLKDQLFFLHAFYAVSYSFFLVLFQNL